MKSSRTSELADPVVQSTVHNGSQFTIQVRKTAGLTYSLYRSSGLSYGTWFVVSGAIIANEGDTVALTDAAACGNTWFYRVLAEQ